ncbi:MAG: hypothetical protein GY862_20960 [Gammaproteobacteria bacterium]|nr:hypothetical protein [Gammaproteobacteria bacterium]
MSESAFASFSTAHDLPSSWDKGCQDNPLLCRSRLRILEQVNPCGQRYYLLENRDSTSLFLTYQHRLDILTYGKGSLRLPVTIIGLPCSVSWPGIHIQQQDVMPFTQAQSPAQPTCPQRD